MRALQLGDEGVVEEDEARVGLDGVGEEFLAAALRSDGLHGMEMRGRPMI